MIVNAVAIFAQAWRKPGTGFWQRGVGLLAREEVWGSLAGLVSSWPSRGGVAGCLLPRLPRLAWRVVAGTAVAGECAAGGRAALRLFAGWPGAVPAG